MVGDELTGSDPGTVGCKRPAGDAAAAQRDSAAADEPHVYFVDSQQSRRERMHETRCGKAELRLKLGNEVIIRKIQEFPEGIQLLTQVPLPMEGFSTVKPIVQCMGRCPCRLRRLRKASYVADPIEQGNAPKKAKTAMDGDKVNKPTPMPRGVRNSSRLSGMQR